MDPITIIGTAGSVANIVDTLSKVIGKLREIHHQWKDADLALMNLVSQLTALRAALTKIEEWMGCASPDDHYYQLEMDLDLSLTCCRTLVENLSSQISGLSTKEDGSLAPTARMRLILGASKLDELQKFVDRQTSALTLLLTACNCKSVSEQKTHLERKSTRKIMSVIEKDTASLLVHRDGDSSQTLSTDRGSQLSRTFTFDGQLWRSQVYEKVNRQLIKRTIRIQQSHQPKSSTKLGDQGACSNNFGSDNLLPGNRAQPLVASTNMRDPAFDHEHKIIVLGARDAGKSTILKQMTMIYQGGYTAHERLLFRPAIYNNLADCAVALVKSMDEFGVEPEKPGNLELCERILAYERITRRELVSSDLEPIASVWADANIRSVMESQNSSYLRGFATYLFDNASRIAAPDYLPTEADLLKYNIQTTGISESHFTMGKLPVCMIDVGGSRSERKKWVEAFGDVNAMLFIVDLASYDQGIPENPEVNTISESLALFDSLVNSKWFTKTTIFLIFNKLDEFRLKIATIPLKDYCPDYVGGTDLEQGMQYLANRFTQLNKSHAPVVKRFIRAIDENDVRLMCAQIEETIIQNGRVFTG